MVTQENESGATNKQTIRRSAGPQNRKDKHIGFKHVAAKSSEYTSLETEEKNIRDQLEQKWWLTKILQATFSNFLVLFVHLITAETLLSCCTTIGLTFFWYKYHEVCAMYQSFFR
jgi:hypothetical protein